MGPILFYHVFVDSFPIGLGQGYFQIKRGAMRPGVIAAATSDFGSSGNGIGIYRNIS